MQLSWQARIYVPHMAGVLATLQDQICGEALFRERSRFRITARAHDVGGVTRAQQRRLAMFSPGRVSS
jgi:hypothetical protein